MLVIPENIKRKRKVPPIAKETATRILRTLTGLIRLFKILYLLNL